MYELTEDQLEYYENVLKMDKQIIKKKIGMISPTVFDVFCTEAVMSNHSVSHDVCDDVYDVCVCMDLPDHVEDLYDEAIIQLMKHMYFGAISGSDCYVLYMSQFVREHTDLVYELSQYYRTPMLDKDLDKEDYEYEEEDSLYMGVQCLTYVISGDAYDSQYKMIVDYFEGKSDWKIKDRGDTEDETESS